jgi:hypothetical protein
MIDEPKDKDNGENCAANPANAGAPDFNRVVLIAVGRIEMIACLIGRPGKGRGAQSFAFRVNTGKGPLGFFFLGGAAFFAIWCLVCCHDGVLACFFDPVSAFIALGAELINHAHSARAILLIDKEESRDNVVHFQGFPTQAMGKSASPFGFAVKHPSIEPMTAKREPPLFCHWFLHMNTSRQTKCAELIGSAPIISYNNPCYGDCYLTSRHVLGKKHI